MSKDEAVLPHIGNEEPHSLFFISFPDLDPAVLGDLPLSVLCAIYVVDCDWLKQCERPCSKGLPGFFIYEVLECALLCGLLHCQEFEISMNCFDFPAIHHVYLRGSEVSCFFSMI